MTNQTTPTRLLFPSPDDFDEAGRALTQKQLNDMNFHGTSHGDFAAENNTVVES
jgi:hypothetical protein